MTEEDKAASEWLAHHLRAPNKPRALSAALAWLGLNLGWRHFFRDLIIGTIALVALLAYNFMFGPYCIDTALIISASCP